MRFLALSLVLLSACVPASVSPQFRNEAAVSVPVAPVYGNIVGEIDGDNANLVAAAELLVQAPAYVHFRIDSPGGSVRIGLAFIERMREAQANGTVIACTIDGMAASMAAVIFERCDVRMMKRDAALMFHTVSIGGAEGNQWEMERLAKMMAGLNRRLAILAAAKMKISLAEYEARVRDNDWWLGWEEAVTVGAADSGA